MATHSSFNDQDIIHALQSGKSLLSESNYCKHVFRNTTHHEIHHVLPNHVPSRREIESHPPNETGRKNRNECHRLDEFRSARPEAVAMSSKKMHPTVVVARPVGGGWRAFLSSCSAGLFIICQNGFVISASIIHYSQSHMNQIKAIASIYSFE
jgi:hypothetical protein